MRTPARQQGLFSDAQWRNLFRAMPPRLPAGRNPTTDSTEN